jgi:hypothetical protein
VASPDDDSPALRLQWEAKELIGTVCITFDSDYDHPAESSLFGHPEYVPPFRCKSWQLTDETGKLLAERDDDRGSRVELHFDAPVEAQGLVLHVGPTYGGCPPSVFEVSVFAPGKF